MIGQVKIFAGVTAPAGHAFCDGSELIIADHPSLYAVIGHQFGGDGITTFALPDLRQRAVRGAEFTTSLGNDTAVLTVDNLPAHTHQVAIGVNTEVPNTNEGSDNVFGSGSNIFSTQPAEAGENLGGVSEQLIGSGETFSVENPNLKLNFIIQTA